MPAWHDAAPAELPEHGSDILHATELFSGLPRDTLADIACRCRWHAVDAGHLLIDAAAGHPHGVFVLVSGDVEVFRTDAGATVPLATIAAIDCFGEFAAIRGEPGSASVRSLSPCRLGEMPAAVFMGLLAERTCFSMRLLRRVVGTVRTLDAAIAGAQRRDVRDRAWIDELYRDLAMRSL